MNNKNVSCIDKFDNVKKQKIYEGLRILKENPSINRDIEDLLKVLRLYY